jgi:hypothetical protein
VALAVTPEELEAALLAAEPYRAQRLASGPPAISMTQAKRTVDGTIVTGLIEVPGSTAGKAYGAALVDVSIATLWSAINDETRLPGWTSVAYAEILVGQPCVDGRRVLQYIDVPWVDDRWWIGVPKQNRTMLRNSGGSVREMTFQSSVDATEIKTASGQKIIGAAVPIAFSRGGWFLIAVDARTTYVEYYVWSDPGPGIPSSLASTFATKGVRDNLAAIFRFAKEGKPSCPLE